MSRSVRQDYDTLRRTPHHVYLRAGDVAPVFIGTTIPMTEEQLFHSKGFIDNRFQRKTESYVVCPTNEDWAKYHQAKKALLTLRAYENTIGDEDIEIPMPKPKTLHRYTETQEAWLERCRLLEAEQEAA